MQCMKNSKGKQAFFCTQTGNFVFDQIIDTGTFILLAHFNTNLISIRIDHCVLFLFKQQSVKVLLQWCETFCGCNIIGFFLSLKNLATLSHSRIYGGEAQLVRLPSQ